MKAKYKPEKDRIVLSMTREEARTAYSLMGISSIISKDEKFVASFIDAIRAAQREHRIFIGAEDGE